MSTVAPHVFALPRDHVVIAADHAVNAVLINIAACISRKPVLKNDIFKNQPFMCQIRFARCLIRFVGGQDHRAIAR